MSKNNHVAVYMILGGRTIDKQITASWRIFNKEVRQPDPSIQCGRVWRVPGSCINGGLVIHGWGVVKKSFSNQTSATNNTQAFGYSERRWNSCTNPSLQSRIFVRLWTLCSCIVFQCPTRFELGLLIHSRLRIHTQKYMCQKSSMFVTKNLMCHCQWMDQGCNNDDEIGSNWD